MNEIDNFNFKGYGRGHIESKGTHDCCGRGYGIRGIRGDFIQKVDTANNRETLIRTTHQGYGMGGHGMGEGAGGDSQCRGFAYFSPITSAEDLIKSKPRRADEVIKILRGYA